MFLRKGAKQSMSMFAKHERNQVFGSAKLITAEFLAETGFAK